MLVGVRCGEVSVVVDDGVERRWIARADVLDGCRRAG